jgi:hypothetical protein
VKKRLESDEAARALWAKFGNVMAVIAMMRTNKEIILIFGKMNLSDVGGCRG